jgi:hypothetical protein
LIFGVDGAIVIFGAEGAIAVCFLIEAIVIFGVDRGDRSLIFVKWRLFGSWYDKN